MNRALIALLFLASPVLAGSMDHAYDLNIRAADLSQAYHDNQVWADQQYQGREIKVNGAIHQIKNDGEEGPRLILSGASYYLVRCMFSDPTELVNLRTGNFVTVRGTVKGGNQIVDLVACHLVK